MIRVRDYIQGDEPLTVLVLTETERDILRDLIHHADTHAQRARLSVGPDEFSDVKYREGYLRAVQDDLLSI